MYLHVYQKGVLGIMLIDSHIHAFSEKIAERAIRQLEITCGTKALTDGTAKGALSLMRSAGVDRAVLLPIATKPTQQTVINDWAASLDGRDGLISFGSVHPDAADMEDELRRIKALGLHGVKLHPDYQGFFINEKRLDPLWDALEQLDLPVVVHAGLDPLSPDRIYCMPDKAAEMLSRHPKLKIVLAHMGGNEHWQEALDSLCGISGEVYLDTAYILFCPDDLLTRMIRKHGADRVLFASDCPWTDPAQTFRKIDSLPLTDDEKEKIFHQNAERLLSL